MRLNLRRSCALVLAANRTTWSSYRRPRASAMRLPYRFATPVAGKAKLVKVNAGTSPQVSQRFGIQAIPALLVLRHGQVAARQTGAVPLATLRTWAGNALAVG